MLNAADLLQAFGATPIKQIAPNSQSFRIEGKPGVVMLAGVKTDWELQQRVSLGLAEATRERFAPREKR